MPPARVRCLPRLAVHAQRHREIVRVRDLVRRHDPRAERAERVDRLAEREDSASHPPPLDVARGDVVEDHVAGDIVHRLLGPNHLPSLPMIHRELELVVELLGQVLRIDDRLVRADDRVDVLEEDDPRRDLVRPVDVLRLLLVLAEVARRGGRTSWARSARATSRPRAARGHRSSEAPPRSKYSRIVGTSRTDDLVALDPADLSVVVGDELHGASSQASTSAAFRVGREHQGRTPSRSGPSSATSASRLYNVSPGNLEGRQAERGAEPPARGQRSPGTASGCARRTRAGRRAPCAESPATRRRRAPGTHPGTHRTAACIRGRRASRPSRASSGTPGRAGARIDVQHREVVDVRRTPCEDLEHRGSGSSSPARWSAAPSSSGTGRFAQAASTTSCDTTDLHRHPRVDLRRLARGPRSRGSRRARRPSAPSRCRHSRSGCRSASAPTRR